MRILFLMILVSNRLFSQQSIDSNQTFTIGGIKQYVRIQGKDVSKPLLLFLHGGPGGSLMQKTDRITGKLRQHFIVVHWDQRETGETLRLNRSTQPLTLQLFYDDTHDLVDSLLKHFGKEKLYLAGYSWGSGLGFYMADKYPELLHAYLAISPVIDGRRSDSISLAMLKETMGGEARSELSQVKIPFENADQLYYHRKWLFKQEGKGLLAITFRKSTVRTWAATWFEVWSRSNVVNLFKTLPAIKCPVYFFAGANDYNTNSAITREYYDIVTAPKKELFFFRDAGHGLPETDPIAFQDIIISKLLLQKF